MLRCSERRLSAPSERIIAFFSKCRKKGQELLPLSAVKNHLLVVLVIVVDHLVVGVVVLAALCARVGAGLLRAGGVTLLGNQHTQYPTDYDPSVLETFENKHPEHDYMVTFRCPEFTTLCPITGQPDFATLYINYVPDKRMVESKSLKLYLFSFRNHGDFHEDVVNVVMRDLVELMDPKYIEVRGMFYPRGGISIYPFANWARPGAGYEQIAAERMFAQLSDLDSGDGARG